MYYQENMFHCIKIASVELVNRKGEQNNILNEHLTDAINVSLYHYYIHSNAYKKWKHQPLRKQLRKGIN